MPIGLQRLSAFLELSSQLLGAENKHVYRLVGPCSIWFHQLLQNKAVDTGENKTRERSVVLRR